MKILRLDLLAFGPFADLSLDLSAGHEGLHIVYGPNEAGKSTALRALSCLFYGVPHNSPDCHRHATTDLRIGASLRLADGRTLEIIRRKGRANTLRAGDDATPVDAAVLSAALSHLDEDAFKLRFGINHERLEAGGKEIAGGRGDVGQLLFAAGSGVANLARIEEQLDEEAASLYKPRGKQQLNRLLSEHETQRKALRDAVLTAEEWDRRSQSLAANRAEQERLASELATTNTRLARAQRIRSALPVVAARQATAQALDKVADAPRLPADFSARRRDASRRFELARMEQRKAAEELARFDARLAELGPPPAILDAADEIDRLPLDSHLKAARDREGLVAEAASLDQRIATALAKIGRHAEDDARADAPLLAVTARARIEELSDQFMHLQQQRESASRRHADAMRQLRHAREQLAATAAIGDGEALAAALARIQPLLAVESQLAALHARLAADQDQWRIDVARLPFFSGDATGLESLRLPSAEAIDRHEEQLADAQRNTDQATASVREAEDELAQVDAKLRSFMASGGAPSEEQLAAARHDRDAAWQKLRVDIATGDVATATRTCGEVGPLIAAADELADRLRREADRVAQRQQLEGQRRDRVERLGEREAAASAARETLSASKSAWQADWQAAGVTSRSVREMRAFVIEHARLCQEAARLRRESAGCGANAQRVAEAKQELAAALQSAGVELSAGLDLGNATLAQLADTGQRLTQRLSVAREQRRRAAVDVEHHALDEAAARDEAAETTGRLDAWSGEWAKAVAPLATKGELSPGQAKALLRELGEVQASVDARRDRVDRIAGIDLDAAEFARRLASLVPRVAADLAEEVSKPDEISTAASEKIVLELRRRLTAARGADRVRQSLGEQRDRWKVDSSEMEKQLLAARAALEALCREAGAAAGAFESGELSAIEQRAAERAQLENRLAELDDRLRDAAVGGAVDEFIVEVASENADGLPGEIERLTAEVMRLSAEHDAIRDDNLLKQRDLDSLDGSRAAAEANAELQSLAARIGDDAGRFVRLKLASAVLRRAVERYREKNQAPLLARSGELFAQLTCGAFERLDVDYDDTRPVLVAVRSGGKKKVAIGGMSDGTCDQLYLALRLASVEQYLKDHPPIPFVVDDILHRFDDERSTAALRALAALSRKTQVIFFTHHEHVVDLAQRSLDDDICFAHRIDRTGVLAAD